MSNNLIIISILVLVSIFVYFDNNLIKVSKYKIKSDKLPITFNKFKIIHLSDFHNYGSKIYSTQLIKKINNENPNIIIMTGDMINKYDKNFEKFLKLSEILSKRYDIYYIWGNHEKKLEEDNLNLIMKKLNEFGIKILNNNKAAITREKEHINIYGLDIPLSYYRIRNRPDDLKILIDKGLKKCSKDEYNILLAHNPLFFEIYAKYNVDVIFSGHVHGGMIRLPFLGALLSPERKFFPKYNGGIYEINNKKLIVSRGVGHSSPAIRLFNMPEILSITLVN